MNVLKTQGGANQLNYKALGIPTNCHCQGYYLFLVTNSPIYEEYIG